MPEIKIKQIVSFSSEDKVFKAENLLKAETYRKWKCATAGEKKVCAVMQFEKATQIHSIHIGNEHSAFVEVLVARSSEINVDYKVLLVASSFMTPLESRNGTNGNRVRMFDGDKLAQNLKDEKWDLVQLVCTQPFNKTVQYGLSFVKFLSPTETNDETESGSQGSQSMINFGAIQMKVQEEEEMSVGKWFFKQRNTNNTSSTSPSAIRQASSFASATLASNRSALTSPPVPSSKPEQGFKRKLEDNSKKLTVPAAKKAENHLSSSVNKQKVELSSNSNNDRSPRSSNPSSPKAALPKVTASPKVSTLASQVPSHPRENASKKENETPKKPLSKVMEKVVFVLSGFQNPYRNDLRKYALEMGAKYKGDWDSSCTHLVCAFTNTPKYGQVKAKGGRIVTKDWIVDCYKKRQALPWRKYMLGKYKKDSSSEEELEEEDEDEEYVPKPKQPKLKNEIPKKVDKPNGLVKAAVSPKVTPTLPTTSKPDIAVRIPESIDDDSTDAEIDFKADTDIDEESDGGDTEDELKKAESLSKKQNSFHSPKEPIVERQKPVDVSSKRPDTSSMPLPELPDFLKRKVFFLFGKFKEQERHDLERYIIAYNGIVADYMDETVKYVVTLSKWNKDFDEALSENDNLIFVHPRWIHKCHQMEKLLPYQPHIVVPEED